MAMFSTESGGGRMKPGLIVILLAGALVSGCAGDDVLRQSGQKETDDFGRAVREDLAAQIANPDPAWKNAPPPPSSGTRAALAQTRYQKNTVIKPVGATTSSVTTTGGGGGQAGGGGGEAGGGPQ
jgi:hypothetical protein